MPDTESHSSPARSNVPLWIAQCFGVGRIPFAPGTWGSVVGVLWFLFLVSPGNPVWFAIAAIAGIFLSVWSCGCAEKILGEKDSSSLVIDELIAVPLCFVSWLILVSIDRGAFPGAEYLLGNDGQWPRIAIIFVLFRFFDIAKPWPVRRSEVLPGGWGVTADDLLAAVYVNLAVLGLWVIGWWG